MRFFISKTIFFVLCVYSCTLLANENPATAFFYSKNLPVDLLAAYDRVVVEPENTTSEEIEYLTQHGVTVYAYLSIGEVANSRHWFKEINDDWKLGINTSWNSTVMDMSASGWRNFLLTKRMRQLWQMGFRGFFLDTMDSYLLFSDSEQAKQKQQKGMVKLITSMKYKYPGISLLFNRGFEIIDKVATLTDGVVAESLYAGWNAEKNTYLPVDEQGSNWLLAKLKAIKEHYNLPVVVIDYVPPEQREKAKKVADKILKLGFVPWVSNPQLNFMGVGSKDIIERKVLYLYDSKDRNLAFHPLHAYFAMPLEYQGYVPVYWDINQGLPSYLLKGQYAGIVTWFYGVNKARDKILKPWLTRQIQLKIPIAFMGQLSFLNDPEITTILNVDFLKQNLSLPLKIDSVSEHMGFETDVQLRYTALELVNSRTGHPWISIKDNNEKVITPVFTDQWGGVALNPYIFTSVPAIGKEVNYSRWVFDPFEFLKEALQLRPLPVPDLTTENGSRIMTIHIDGDGFYNHSQAAFKRFSSEVIMDDFIKPLSLPHTVSIIEAEIGKRGLRPDLSDRLEPIAQEIFKLPNVEIASHSFSHPFKWFKAAETSHLPLLANESEKKLKVKADKDLQAGYDYTEQNKSVFKAEAGHYHLPIPGYRYSAEREIKGSISYIDKLLAPKNKKTKIFLWTGDCLPNEEALAWTYKMGVMNLNGGDTIIRKGMNSMTNVSSSGISRGSYFQPFAPVQNENVYTNDWTGPYFGYQRVIETFELTDKEKRLKPISIYYHFYSGDRMSSLRALRRVYDWAIDQETIPMWISEYVPRVYGFRTVAVEKTESGWNLFGTDQIRTLRLPESTQQLDVKHSKGVAGMRNIGQSQFIALSGENKVSIKVAKNQNLSPYLLKSNARVDYWKYQGKDVIFSLSGHQKINLTLDNMDKSCQLIKDDGNKLSAWKKVDKQSIFKFSESTTGSLRIACENS